MAKTNRILPLDKQTISAEDMAKQIVRTEANGLREELEKLGPPLNWTSAVNRSVLRIKIVALERYLEQSNLGTPPIDPSEFLKELLVSEAIDACDCALQNGEGREFLKTISGMTNEEIDAALARLMEKDNAQSQ